jgi:lipoprotein-anchoring transpeptidase ErfK/SrfK
MSSLAAVALAAAASTAVTSSASAQGLIDFLWGGSKEYGGSKQTVSFNPKYTSGQIIVSFSDRRLYLITKPGQAISYPIAVPREVDRWQGSTTITSKRENPSWRPTPDMLRENPRLPSWVPGGHPMNPLGVRALYLGSSLYRIHGTDAPWTIGEAVSKGCIRMFNKDVLDLYPRVSTGTKVTVTWERFSTQGGVAFNDEPEPAASHRVSAVMPGHRGPPRTIRQRTPSAEAEQVAAIRTLEVDDAQPARPERKSEQAKPEKKPEAAKAQPAKEPAKTSEAKKPAVKAPEAKQSETKVAARKVETPAAATAPAADHSEAAAAAKKAAAAAKKAAAAARAAAEAARQAAEDARRATEQEQSASARAAL